jgi:ankyrin repeat protein
MTTAAPGPDAIRDVVLSAHGNFAKVKEMIEADPRLLNVSAPWEETPLQAASHMGNRQIAEWLLERGASLDVFAAAMLGRTDDVARFLDQEPELVRQRGVHGMPILFFPAAAGQRAAAELLVARGAEVNAGAGGNTALHAAAYFGRREMAEWLLERGADPAATDYEGKTPLQVAEEHGHGEVAEMLRQVNQPRSASSV